MPALWRLTLLEMRLLLRDRGSLIALLAIPLFVIGIFGLSFGLEDGMLPAMAAAIALALNALYAVPTYLGTYREKGILRRLATTPLSPATLLGAQLLVHCLTMLVAVGLVVLLAWALGMAPPANPAGAALALGLGTGAMFALGVLIAAVASNGRAASGIGVLTYFPLAFLGGITIPPAQMPPLLARIGAWTPLGAFRQALQDAWLGGSPAPRDILVLAGCMLLIGAMAVWLFRWE